MAPYLKQRLFEDLQDAPALNADGKFLITPECKEWAAWREHVKQTYSAGALQRLDKRKTIVVDTRWPPEGNQIKI